LQTSDPQSLLPPHALPPGHVGAHVGAAHVLSVHTPEAQSPFPPHALSNGQVGAQAARHLPFAHDVPTAQT
jgi:hypothetical protein